MHETGQKLLNLMFRSGETICVSHNKYGYHSIPLENAINGPVTLVPPDDKHDYEYPQTDQLILVALNPIKGFRQDVNCTAYRNFLIEMDYGPLPEQMAYMKKLGMPYSAAIFSGNKSIHFLVSLDKDLPNENTYRFFAEWILGIVSLADQNTKNPSRSIRMPGAYREPGKKQLLIEMPGTIKLDDLVAWLKRYPDSKPKEKQERKISDKPDFEKIKPWICEKVYSGIRPPNRNKQWFTVGVEFALAGYSEDDTLDRLQKYFEPDRDFKQREWETSIKSAFKWTYERKQS